MELSHVKTMRRPKRRLHGVAYGNHPKYLFVLVVPRTLCAVYVAVHP